MILSSGYTWIPMRRVATLTLPVVERLFKKYKISPQQGGYSYNSPEDILYLNESLAKARVGGPNEILIGKEDLVTEWILSSISTKHSGRWDDDLYRFMDEATFFFTNYKTDKFKAAVRELSNEIGYNYNPKNLLDFSLHEMEEVHTLFSKPIEDPRVNSLQDKLPEGSSMFFNNGKYQIVEAKTSSAACDLARGTKWCTSKPEIAETYLKTDPLYIFYKSGKKFAQLHIGLSYRDIQFMDLKDNDIEITNDLKNLVVDSGMVYSIFDSVTKGVYSLYYDALRFWLTPESASKVLPYMAKDSSWAFTYAQVVLKGRFPEGESAISKDPDTSVLYAEEVLNDRFKPGEGEIVQSKYLGEYLKFLGRIGKSEEFIEDHPEITPVLRKYL